MKQELNLSPSPEQNAMANARACRATAELLARNVHLDDAAGPAVGPVLRLALAEEERARRIRAAMEVAA